MQSQSLEVVNILQWLKNFAFKLTIEVYFAFRSVGKA